MAHATSTFTAVNNPEQHWNLSGMESLREPDPGPWSEELHRRRIRQAQRVTGATLSAIGQPLPAAFRAFALFLLVMTAPALGATTVAM